MFDASSDAIPGRSCSNRNPKAIVSHKIKDNLTG